MCWEIKYFTSRVKDGYDEKQNHMSFRELFNSIFERSKDRIWSFLGAPVELIDMRVKKIKKAKRKKPEKESPEVEGSLQIIQFFQELLSV